MPVYSRYLTPKIDPAQVQDGNAFAYWKDTPTIADTNEDPFLLIKNTTSGSSATAMVVYFRRVQARANTYQATARFYAAPTITSAGSAASAVNRKVGGGSSAMSLFTGSSISANGSLLDALTCTSPAASESSDSIIVVPAGTNLLVTLQASNTGAVVLFGLDWYEVP